MFSEDFQSVELRYRQRRFLDEANAYRLARQARHAKRARKARLAGGGQRGGSATSRAA